MNRQANELIYFCLDIYRLSANKWLSSVDQQLHQLAHKNALLSWQLNTNRSIQAEKELSLFQTQESAISAVICQQRSRWTMELLTPLQQKMMARICHGLRLTPNDTRLFIIPMFIFNH